MALLCCYCSAKITSKRKIIVHINICQKPSIKYFCNQNCKLNWIFKRSDLKLDKEISDNRSKEEVKSLFDMTVIEDKADDLERYLKEHNLKILREA